MSNALVLARGALVRIEGDYQGSGAVVGHRDDGSSLILTCAHAIGNSELIVQTSSGTKVSAAISGKNDKLDLALLRTSQRLDLNPLHFSTTDPTPGDELVIAHCPASEPQAWLACTGEMQSPCPPHRFYFTAHGLWSGSSGGPVVDFDGALVGVMREMELDRNQIVPGLGIAASLRAIKRFFRSAEGQ